MSLLAWIAVVFIHSTAAYSDLLRRGGHGSLGGQIAQFAPAYVPWVFLSTFLLVFLSKRRAGELGERKLVARTFLTIFGVFLVPECAFQVALTMLGSGRPWSEFLFHFANWPAIYWLIDAGLFVLTFALVYAVVSTRASRAAHAHRLKTDAENLTLRLELERQRLRALRGQLEPHFMFNALNAISGLVRGEDKSLALSALQQLSSLLRYALLASSRDFVALGEEIDFVRDYVRLQTLRFGDRLRVQIEEGPHDLREFNCPPLLLQPLVENAIRHDLETHEGASQVDVSISRQGDRVILSVRNGRREGAATNPGSGLGLPSTRERLRLLYGEDAELQTSSGDGVFVARVALPTSGPSTGEK